MSAISNLSFPIEKFFPKESYKTQCSQDKKLIPIYLTALNQGIEIIKKSLKRENCEYRDKEYGLTILTVAVMVKRFDVIKHLLADWKVSPSPKDNANLTPFHYACVLQDAKSMILLQNANKAQKVSIDRFEIFPGWKKVLQPQFPKDEKVVGYIDQNGAILPMTAKQFSETTGAFYYDGVIALDGQRYVDFFASSLKVISLNEKRKVSNDQLCQQFSAFTPPKLYLSKQGKAHYGVCAHQKIKVKEFCGIYAGEASDDCNSYSIGFIKQGYIISGKTYRNFLGMVNDGFPNVSFFRFILPDGRLYFAMIALDSIEAGEGILWDYGHAHDVKKFLREEIGIKKIETFFKENPLRLLARRLANLEYLPLNNLNDPTFTEYHLKKGRLDYVLGTPSLMYYLFIIGVVSLEDISFFYKCGYFNQMDSSGRLHTVYEVFMTQFAQIDVLVKECKDEETIASFRKQFGELYLSHAYDSLIASEVYLDRVQNLKELIECKQNLDTLMTYIDMASLYQGGYEIDLKAFIKIKKDFDKLPSEITESIVKVNSNLDTKQKYADLLLAIEKLQISMKEDKNVSHL